MSFNKLKSIGLDQMLDHEDKTIVIKEEKIIKKEIDENNNKDEENENQEESKSSAGNIVWGCQSKFLWYPCMILEDINDDEVKVGYFKGVHQIAYLLKKNTYMFDNDTTIAKKFNVIVKALAGKKHSVSTTSSRECESAVFFLQLSNDDRISLYSILQTISRKYKNLNEFIEKKSDVGEFDRIGDLLIKYINYMNDYDNKRKELAALKNEKRLSSNVSIKKETVEQPKYLSQRISTRIVGKRRMEDEKPGIIVKKEQKPPKPKKPKVAVEETLESLFLTEHLETDKDCLFRSYEEVTVCSCCYDIFKNSPILCAGCNQQFHKECIAKDADDINMKYLCEMCCRPEKSCCICNKNFTSNDSKIFNCKQSNCNSIYHKKCLALVSKNSKTCLKHFCHTCYLKDCSKEGPIVSCIKCPMTYHADILCIPVGTQVISRTQIICPQHKPDEKTKQINVDYCCYCAAGGKLVCCDTCPRSFHTECLTVAEFPETNNKFKCDVCTAGIVPLYNSIVWAKVGTFRWWPAFVMVPWVVPLPTLNRQNSDWEFCIRFLGTYDFAFTTSEKVFTFDVTDSVPKLSSKKSLDAAFNKAMKEAKELVSIFETKDLVEIEKSDSVELKSSKSIYKAIQICRPIPPVKLKKIPPEPCNCKETDENPCSRKSNCINAVLFTECDEFCSAGKKCLNQRVRNRENANLRIVKTKSRGYGAFCKDDIEPNTFIIEYIGELINNEELNRRMMKKNKRKEKEFYFLNVQNNLYIDAEFYSNKGRFINHSCDPNCDIRKINVDGITRIGIFSNQYIKAGTELTFNYQMEFGKGFGIKCNCGSKNCTGVIGKFSKPK